MKEELRPQTRRCLMFEVCLGKLTRAEQRFAHLNESPDDKHIDSRSPDRSPVSQTDNAVHPTASPHVVFICTARELRKTFAACNAP
jgi:hypothetical protein